MTVGSYQRRNERARAAGYRNYYDYRLHNHGKTPPGAPLPPKGERGTLRGHRADGRAALLRNLRPGDLVSVQSTDRNPRTGRLRRVDLVVIDENGDQRTYTIKGPQLTQRKLDELSERLAGAGAVFSPSPSLDLRQISEAPDLDDEEPEA